MQFLVLRSALLGLLGLATLGAQAQNEPVKFGKVDAQLFDVAQYKAGDAPAVVLCDYGTSRVEGADDAFQIVFDRVTRILVLNKAGYDQATVEIPLYHHDKDEEKLDNLRACTYNLVGNKVEKLPLDTKTVFNEKLDARHNVRKFTLAGVREGSIIEYTYTIKSDFLFNLQDWRFQRDIPVVWSEYRAVMPSFLQYKQIPHGFLPYSIDERTVVPYSTTYRSIPKDSYGNRLVDNAQVSRLTTKAISCRWVMQHVPAFHNEPYMTTARDYLAGVDFELDVIQFDPNRPEQVTSTWEKISADLLKDDDFGGWLTRRSPLSAQAEALISAYPDPAARAAAAVALVQQNLRYNGEEYFRAVDNISARKALGQQNGNAAEMNLLLVRTLRDAGLSAAPVLVSTRSHGRVQTEIPLLTQFNYVVADVQLPGSQELLLDATEPIAAPGTLPARCLNGQGRVIVPGGGRWVSLAPKQKYVRVTNAQLKLDAQGRIQGNLHREFSGYAGLAERHQLADKGEKAYVSNLQHEYADWQLARSTVRQADNASLPLVFETDMVLPATADAATERLYLPIMQFFTDRQNPFLPDNRLYPVDFGAAHEDVTIVSLALPAGYTVEELPKNAVLDLPGGHGRYSYEAVVRDNVLYLTSRLQLRKTEFMPQEYAGLRELFTRAVAKHTEPLVLRRQP